MCIRDRINTLKEEMQAIADEKAEIEQNRQEVAAAKTELDNKRNELGELESEAQRVLDELTANEQSMQSESNSLAAQQKKIEQEEAQAAAEIDQWWANYYASQNGGQSSSGNTTTPESYVGGQFTWPVPGYTHISCGYSSSHKAIEMCIRDRVGKEVVYLKRLRIGALDLDPALQPGQARPLLPEEREKVFCLED